MADVNDKVSGAEPIAPAPAAATIPVKPVEAPANIHEQTPVVTVPVQSTDKAVVVHVPTIHDLPPGTVVAPGITVA